MGISRANGKNIILIRKKNKQKHQTKAKEKKVKPKQKEKKNKQTNKKHTVTNRASSFSYTLYSLQTKPPL